MTTITRRRFFEYAGASALASTFIGDRVLSATPPNILLIVADDLGQHIGCYGDTTARTPSIDRLATQGIRFINSYVTQASCSPSRSSIYTGLYPHQTGFFPPDKNPVGQIGLAYPGSGYEMDARVITMQQLLKMAGYRIGHIGKLHVYPEASFPFDYRGPDDNGTRDIELIARRAGEFLGQQPQQPFFLTMCYFDPHGTLLYFLQRLSPTTLWSHRSVTFPLDRNCRYTICAREDGWHVQWHRPDGCRCWDAAQ